MLPEESVQLEIGRASHGGDFLRLLHLPTGLSRHHPGPLRGINRSKLVQSLLSEIEAELVAKGLHQYIVHDSKQPKYRP